MDSETGLYYYGARYLDPKYSHWLSPDPAMGDYIPQAPVNDEARKHNQNLPGQGGIFNTVNLQVYHYAGNNPVKYTDPDGSFPIIFMIKTMQHMKGTLPHTTIPFAEEGCTFAGMTGIINDFRGKNGMGKIDWQKEIDTGALNKYFDAKGSLDRSWLLKDFTGGKLKIVEDTRDNGASPADTLTNAVNDKEKGSYILARTKFPLNSGKKTEHEIGVAGLTGKMVNAISTSEHDPGRNYSTDNSANKINRVIIIQENE